MSTLNKLPAGTTLPVKIRTITLFEDYEGWAFIARTNPPSSFFDEFARDDLSIGERADLLAIAIREWNFVDENGEELGDPTPEKLRSLPPDLLLMVMRTYDEAVGEETSIPKD